MVNRATNSLGDLLSNGNLPAVNNALGAGLELCNGFFDAGNGKVPEEIVVGWALADLEIYILPRGRATDHPGSPQQHHLLKLHDHERWQSPSQKHYLYF